MAASALIVSGAKSTQYQGLFAHPPLRVGDVEAFYADTSAPGPFHQSGHIAQLPSRSTSSSCSDNLVPLGFCFILRFGYMQFEC